MNDADIAQAAVAATQSHRAAQEQRLVVGGSRRREHNPGLPVSASARRLIRRAKLSVLAATMPC